MRRLMSIIPAVVLIIWAGAATAQDGPNVKLPGIKEPDVSPGGCTHRGRNYPEGAVVCKDGFQYKCTDGGWDNRGFECPPEDTAPDGSSVPLPSELQKPQPDDELAPEQMEPAEP